MNKDSSTVNLTEMSSENSKRRFSSLLTVICRTAKKSANKVARIRKTKPVVEEPKKIPLANDVPTQQQQCNSYANNTAKEQGWSVTGV